MPAIETGAFHCRDSAGAIDPAAPFALRQTLFQRFYSLLEPFVIGQRHRGDAGHHANHRREHRACVREQQRARQ
jgi:hypothetical protein